MACLPWVLRSKRASLSRVAMCCTLPRCQCLLAWSPTPSQAAPTILIYSRRHCVRLLSWRLPEKSRQIILLTRPTLHQHWFRHQVFYSLSHTSSTLVGLCPTSRKKKRCPQAFLSLRAHMGKPWTATAKLSPLLKHIETICHRCLSLFHYWFTIAQGFAKSL